VQGSVLALDVGTKTIGLAATDPSGNRIFRVGVVVRKGVKQDCRVLAGICKDRKIVQLVVGLPLELDGSEGRSVRLARQVGEALSALTGLPVAYMDERFSTTEASSRLYEAGLDSRRQRKLIDAEAAAVILEDWGRKDAERQRRRE
jgi:putative Holliday junction resolvase